MKFIIFNGTLKPDEESNTSAVCKMLQLAFKKIGDECEIVTMRDLKYDASTKDVDDELKPHIMDIFKSDGIVFATPIWWEEYIVPLHKLKIWKIMKHLCPSL